MILFRVASHYQLICALFLMEIIDEPADLHLCDVTDFSSIIENIKKTGLFRDVRLVKAKEMSDEWFETGCSLSKFFEQHPCDDENDPEYSVCYFGHDMLPNKLYYYHLLNCQKKAPDIILLEDGLASYSHDIIKHAMGDNIDHSSFGKNSFLEKVSAQYLYDPDLAQPVKRQLLKYPEYNDNIKQNLLNVYGMQDIPDEPYIYFSSCFLENRFTMNEMAIIDSLADIVGKENLIIKQHPRATVDVFAGRGYKLMPQSNIPWEIFLLNEKMKNKILISIASAAMFSSYNIFGIKQGIMELHKLSCGNFPMIDDSTGYMKFLGLVENKFNVDDKQLFIPSDWDQFREMIKYATGRWVNHQ